MSMLQLELNLEDKTPAEMKLHYMQEQINKNCESLRKIQKKLFAELGDLKKEVAQLKMENHDLKSKINPIEWEYGVEGALFDVKERKEAIG